VIGNERVLALIPSREGSKRLPMKALRTLGGKPLILWSVEFAQDCGLASAVAVSTDCAATAIVSSTFGARVIPRPAPLAGDLVPMRPVVAHARTFFPDCPWMLLLQPTSPFRKRGALITLASLLESSGRKRAWSTGADGRPDGGFYLQHIDASHLPLADSAGGDDAITITVGHLDIDTQADFDRAKETL